MTEPAEPVGAFMADTHVRAGAWVDHPIRGDSYYAFEQVVEYACKHELDGVFGAGDILDEKRNRAEPIAFLFSQIDRLKECQVPFYYIRGNHDYDDPPWLSGHSWPVHVDREIVPIANLGVYGL